MADDAQPNHTQPIEGSDELLAVFDNGTFALPPGHYSLTQLSAVLKAAQLGAACLMADRQGQSRPPRLPAQDMLVSAGITGDPERPLAAAERQAFAAAVIEAWTAEYQRVAEQFPRCSRGVWFTS